MKRTRTLAILLFDDVEVLDFCGPFEVFSVANHFTDPAAFNVRTVAEKAGPIRTRGGLSVNPHHPLSDCPRPDLLLVPGGHEAPERTVPRRLRVLGAAAEQLQQIRERAQANLSDRQREVLNYALMFRENTITDELVRALQNAGVPMERWVQEIMAKPDDIVCFSEDIPFIDVFVRLTLLHSPSKVYGKNDVRDLAWLAVALPYGNIVAGETYWTTLAAPLGRKYSTALTNDPQELPKLLAAEGC